MVFFLCKFSISFKDPIMFQNILFGCTCMCLIISFENRILLSIYVFFGSCFSNPLFYYHVYPACERDWLMNTCNIAGIDRCSAYIISYINHCTIIIHQGRFQTFFFWKGRKLLTIYLPCRCDFWLLYTCVGRNFQIFPDNW